MEAEMEGHTELVKWPCTESPVICRISQTETEIERHTELLHWRESNNDSCLIRIRRTQELCA